MDVKTPHKREYHLIFLRYLATKVTVQMLIWLIADFKKSKTKLTNQHAAFVGPPGWAVYVKVVMEI